MKAKHRAKKLLCRVTLLWYRFNIIIQSFCRGKSVICKFRIKSDTPQTPKALILTQFFNSKHKFSERMLFYHE